MEKIAVIGGLGTLSGGDLFYKLLKNSQVLTHQMDYHFTFEQQPYSQMDLPLHQEADIKSRKYYTYNVCKKFEENNITKVLIPCFASHSFIAELQKEIAIPIVNIYEAISRYLSVRVPKGKKIGVLASDFVKNNEELYRHFKDYELIFPENQAQLMESIYGEKGVKNGNFEGLALEHIAKSCTELINKGCTTILPGITELSLVTSQLRKRGISIVDVNQVYADYAIERSTGDKEKQFKIGILGGVGPSATVDFMNKIIQNTPAERDQDHIKMVVEQNPQIPDRTAHLVNLETDPSIAMYATCKRLEAEGANAIAIPCNTAHAFVQDIQEHLNIPIVNMLSVTAKYIKEHYGEATRIGLLATTGTIQSKVYHKVLEQFKLDVVIPDTKNQEYVMDSIYGKRGVKAGFTEGESKVAILKAIDYLVARKAEVIILGCTELPLLFVNEKEVLANNRKIALIDPSLILAKKMVSLAHLPRQN